MAKAKYNFKEGDIYGRLTVVSSDPIYLLSESGRKTRSIKCLCDCGKESIVPTYKLVSSHTTSCGCFLIENRGKSSITHGLCKEPLFDVWRSIIARCDNPNDNRYEWYGARGIGYPVEWKDYHCFMEQMYPTFEEGLTIDRIDVNKGYSKENCRWTNMSVQGHNRRAYEGCTSKYTGVAEHSEGKWTVYINIDKKRCYLFLWTNEEEAAKAYDDASYFLYNDRPNGTIAVQGWIQEKVETKLVLKGFSTKPKISLVMSE